MATMAEKAAQAAKGKIEPETTEQPKVEQPSAIPVNRFVAKFPNFTFRLDNGKEYPQQKDRSGNAVQGTEHLVQAAMAKVELPLGDEMVLEATIYRHDDKTANRRELTFSFPKGFVVPKSGPAAIELERFKEIVLQAFDSQLEAWKAGAAPMQSTTTTKQPRLIKTIS